MQYHVFLAVHNGDVAHAVDRGQVPGAEPAITGEGLLAGLGQLPVALEHSWALALHLSYLLGSCLNDGAV